VLYIHLNERRSFVATIIQGGYTYFDIYDTNQRKIRLVSPVIEPPVDESDRACLTFWFVPLGSGDSTTLQLIQRVGDDNEVLDNEDNVVPVSYLKIIFIDHLRGIDCLLDKDTQGFNSAISKKCGDLGFTP
jgi:hypothetical protein